MWTLPLSWPQKIGVVGYGFVVGAATAIGISLGACLLGLAAGFVCSLFRLNLGEGQAWLPIIGLFYGFGAGVIVGLIVWWRVCVNRLRTQRQESLTGE